jgi:hypothetical protein
MSSENERFIDDAPGIKTGTSLVTILQVNSPRAMGESRIGNGGDILLPGPDGIRVISGKTGFQLQIIHAHTYFVIWPSTRSAGKAGPVDICFGKPPEARWLPDPQRPGKDAFQMPGGGKVRETVYVSAWTDGHSVVLPFAAPQHKEGADLYNAAIAIARDVDGSGDLVKCVAANFRITTDIDHGGGGEPYYAFRWRLAGVLGEREGPSIEEARAGKVLRAAAVREERRLEQAWKIEEAARRTSLINARPQVIEHQPFGGGGVPMSERPRPVITSGREAGAYGEQSSPPPDRYDGPNDSFDDLPNFNAPQRR